MEKSQKTNLKRPLSLEQNEEGNPILDKERLLVVDEIFSLIKKSFRVDFSHYRQTTILRRLRKRIVQSKSDSIEEYLSYIKSNYSELNKLYDDLLLSFTVFFRDSSIFEELKRDIFPQLITNRQRKKPVRIWAPGCSTGQEVYSIAISLFEYLEKNDIKAPIQIFGTDLVDRHIEFARAGIYPEKIINEISEPRLKRFFEKTRNGYKVVQFLREFCVFARQDIMLDPPFAHLDMVSCRNVLIYFDNEMQSSAMPIFHFALNPGGILLLGKSETPGSFLHLFAPIHAKSNFYKKIPSNEITAYTIPDIKHIQIKKQTQDTNDLKTKSIKVSSITYPDIEDIILDNYAPPGILIDRNLIIRRFFGKTNLFLNPVSGEASLKLSQMAGKNLMPDIYVAIEEIKKTGKKIKKKKVAFTRDRETFFADLSIIPVIGEPEEEYYLILFEKSDFKESDILESKADDFNSETDKLREELNRTKDNLQKIIEEKDEVNQELWASNEEVQSANEELQSLNEEMEAAKEEMEATNEELLTLNEELHNKNIELDASNAYLANLVDTANAIIVTLDISAKITTFNKFAEKITGYKKNEVLNRNWFDTFIPERDKLKIPEIFENALKMMPGVSNYENPIVIKSGEEKIVNWRNTVLKNIDGKITGILSIGIDNTEQKVAEAALEEEYQIRASLIEALPYPTMVINKHKQILYANKVAQKIGARINSQCWESFARNENISDEDNKLIASDKSYGPAQIKCFYCKADMAREQLITKKAESINFAGRVWDFYWVPIDEDKYLHFAVDTTDRIKAEKALIESEENLRQIAENIAEVFWIVAPDWSAVYYISPTYEKVWGKSCQSLYEKPSSWKDAVHPDDIQVLNQSIDNKISGIDKTPEFPEYRVVRPDGGISWILARSYPVFDQNGNIQKMAGIAENISERKEAEFLIEEKIAELKRFNKALIGRELKMVELKKEINELRSELNLPGKYNIGDYMG